MSVKPTTCPDCKKPIPEGEGVVWLMPLPMSNLLIHRECYRKRQDAAIWRQDARP
jgi:hypothetical protein